MTTNFFDRLYREEPRKFIYIITVLISILVLLTFVYGRVTQANEEGTEPIPENSVHSEQSPREPTFTGPFCRNGLYMPNTDLGSYVSGGSGLDIGWFIRFGPYPAENQFQQGSDTAGMIRFKPKYDHQGNRSGEYMLAKGIDDDGSDNNIPNEYYPLRIDGITLSMDRFDEGWAQVVRSRPGSLWIVGNEMDRVDLQDSLYPETYAKGYHDAYHFIKSIDPTAQIAIGGIVTVTPGRLQYLELVLDAYRQRYGHKMPIDVWTFHSYVLPEVIYFDPTRDSSAAVALGTDPSLALKDSRVMTSDGVIYQDRNLCQRDDVVCTAEVDDVEIFKEAVFTMRRWMKEHGEQHKPLILTEWSNLYPLDTVDEFGNQMTFERSAIYLEKTITFLETASDPELGYDKDGYRLVQRWNWFQPNPISPADIGGSSIVFDANGTITPVGRAYQNRIAAQRQTESPYVDLIVDHLEETVTPVDPERGVADSRLGVFVRNIGNVATQQPALVLFKDRQGEVIAFGEIPAGLYGCAVYVEHFEETWWNLSPGTHTYSVEIVTAEERVVHRENNSRFGQIMVGERNYFAPFVGREER